MAIAHACVRTRSHRTGGGAGWSLVEALVVVTILGLSLTVAVPPVLAMRDAMALRIASHAFIGSMQLTRMEAVRRGSRVAMCKSRAHMGCVSEGGWEQGWLVFHDANGNGGFDATEEIIERNAGYAGLVFTGNQPASQLIAYTPLGPPRTATGAMLAGTLTVCHRSAEPAMARQIVISKTGRARMQEVRVDICG